MGRDEVDTVLADLGERIGIAGLRLDAAGACQLVFDQRWLVTLLHVPQQAGVALNCPVTAAGHAEQLGAKALRAMLRAGFHGAGSGTTLAIGPDDRAYLQRLLPVTGRRGDALHQALEQLLDLAETWAERLGRAESDPSPPRGDSASAPWAMQRV